MGLLRDAISSATDANKPNNGLGGPSPPWTRTSPTQRNGDYGSQRVDNQRLSPYDDETSRSTRNIFPFSSSRMKNSTCASNNSFQTFGLPQIAHGDGQPFLRGYSSQLGLNGISETEFIRVVDNINVANIPNPENQIVQKGANVAGWFVPGAASFGLMAGQVGAGLGSAYGHASALSRTMSKANLETFLPKGLEICIMNNQTLNSFLGATPSSAISNQSLAGATPEDRLAAYRGFLAPPSKVLPPATRGGRNDPIARVGRGIASRDGERNVRKAARKARRGRTSGRGTAGAEVKWLVVRPASPEALAYLRREREASKSFQSSEPRRSRRIDEPSSRYDNL